MSSRRMTVAVLAILLGTAGGPVSARPRKRTPTAVPVAAGAASPRVQLTPLADGRRVDLAFDAPLLGWAAPRIAGGGRSLYLLIAAQNPPSGPDGCSTETAGMKAESTARLFRWLPGAPEALTLVRADLPADASLDAFDLDGDGNDELILVRAGAIEAIGAGGGGGARSTLVEDGELGRPAGDPAGATNSGPDAPLRLAVVGALRSWRPTPSGTLALASELALPIAVNPSRESVRVSSPEVVSVGRGREGRMLYATAPERIGLDRMRTFLLDPDVPDRPGARECWVRFPERERLLDSAITLLDGKPVLIATSTPADRLSLLGGKRLRVFSLGADRTRVGEGPIFAGETDINLWQVATPVVVDLDRDGRDDLVLAYWKGLTHDLVALEVHRGNADGSFAKARTQELQVDAAETGFLSFGRDLDGDGRPDLGILSGGSFRVYPGTEPENVLSRPVSPRPSRSIALAPGTPRAHGEFLQLELSSGSVAMGRGVPGLGDPRFLDLDGDGRAEVLLVGSDDERAAASILSLRPAKVASGAGISYKYPPPNPGFAPGSRGGAGASEETGSHGRAVESRCARNGVVPSGTCARQP